MAKTQPTGKQLKDTTIERDDLNVSGASGTTVIAKVVQGNDGILLSSTGTDAGTGDVTISGKAMVGATSIAAGKLGDVPSPAAGQQNYFLRGDATWVVAPGTGTVTSVSIVTANGVSGTVATGTTTPAITLTLGAITPTSVTINGAPAVGLLNIHTGTNRNLVIEDDAGGPRLRALNDANSASVAFQLYGPVYFSGGGVNIGGTADPGSGNLWIGGVSQGHLKITATDTPELKFFSTNASAGCRNWAISANDIAAGDFVISQSSTLGGEPMNAINRLYIGATGGVNIGGTTDPGANNLSVAGSVAIGTALPTSFGAVAGSLALSGDLVSTIAGRGLQLRSGSNARVGSGTLVAGTVTISNTSITSGSMVFLQNTKSTSANVGTLRVSSKTAGTSFVVSSTNVADTSTFDYWILEAV